MKIITLVLLILTSIELRSEDNFLTYEELSQEPKNLLTMDNPSKYISDSLRLVELYFIHEGLKWSNKTCQSHRCYYNEDSFLYTKEGKQSLARKQKAIVKIKEMGQKASAALTDKIEQLKSRPDCLVVDSGEKQFKLLHQIISPQYNKENNLLTMVKENVKIYASKHGAPNLMNSFFSKVSGICKVQKKIDPFIWAERCYSSQSKVAVDCFDYDYENITATFNPRGVF